MDTNEVAFAFDILLEAVEAVIDRINEAGAEAFRRGEYREAQQLLGTATQLLDFRDQVIAMRRTWVQRSNQSSSPLEGRPRKTRREHGWRTPQEAFRRPILEALVELGGRASSTEVLERVGQRMADRLTPADHEPLPSNGQIRW
ncbi:MAG: hypothetical protein RMH81_09545 [Thermomicrobium sp.]|nr:hypothetical protein [Thermomicrobium sp.]